MQHFSVSQDGMSPLSKFYTCCTAIFQTVGSCMAFSLLLTITLYPACLSLLKHAFLRWHCQPSSLSSLLTTISPGPLPCLPLGSMAAAGRRCLLCLSHLSPAIFLFARTAKKRQQQARNGVSMCGSRKKAAWHGSVAWREPIWRRGGMAGWRKSVISEEILYSLKNICNIMITKKQSGKRVAENNNVP